MDDLNRRHDVRSSQPEANRRSAVQPVERAGLQYYTRTYIDCPASGEILVRELGTDVVLASCTSTAAAYAAKRLLNGWCER